LDGHEAMKPTSSLYVFRLFLFAILSVIDLILTYRLIHVGGGYIYESNPLANEWLQRFGWQGLAAFKVTTVSLVAFIAIYVSTSRPRVGSRLLNFACLAACTVVVYSFCMSTAVGEGFNDQRPTSYPPLCFDPNAAGARDRDAPQLAPASPTFGRIPQDDG
jgi:hypothetical protein